jgi:putative photosynthetic complex assembly protein
MGFGPWVAVAGALLLIAAVAYYHQSSKGSEAHPAEWSELTESRELRFLDRHDGAVVVLDHPGGDPVEVLAPGTNGFVRGVMRGMARERRSKNIGTEPPYRLSSWADGRLTLDDPSTGRWVELVAFGPDNFQAFAQLLDHGSP